MRHQDTVKRNMFYHCLEYDHQQNGDIYLVASGIEQCDPGETCGPYVRDCYHLHVVFSGTGILYAGGKVFHPSTGQLFLLKDSEECMYISDSETPWHYGWVTFNGPWAKKFVEDMGFTEGEYCLDSRTDVKEFLEIIRKIHSYPEMTDINDLHRRGLLYEYLAKAIEATGHISQQRNHTNQHSVEEYVNRAIDFIHYNYATINVNDVIEFIGFSRSYFSTVFRKQTGNSPQEYLMNYRLNRSRTLLENTELPIQEIALKTGYENQMTFSRTFRRAYGISPTEYRRQEKERKDPERSEAGHGELNGREQRPEEQSCGTQKGDHA